MPREPEPCSVPLLLHAERPTFESRLVTDQQLLALADTAGAAQEALTFQRARLGAGTRLLLLLLRLRFALSPEDSAALESYLSPLVDETPDFGWEERTDAAVTHMLKTVRAGPEGLTHTHRALLGGVRTPTAYIRSLLLTVRHVFSHGSVTVRAARLQVLAKDKDAGKESRSSINPTLTRPADASKLKKHITLLADRLHKGLRPTRDQPEAAAVS